MAGSVAPFRRMPSEVPATNAAPVLSVIVLPAPHGGLGVMVVLLTRMPPLVVGNTSVTDTPVKAVAFGLVSVRVSVIGFAAPPTVLVGLNILTIVGAASAVKVADAPGPAVGVCEVVTPLTLFVIVPADVAVTVTSTNTVQLALAGIFTPLNVTEPTAPPVEALGIAPVHVPRPAPVYVCAAAIVVIPAGKVSPKLPPDNTFASGLVNVNMMVVALAVPTCTGVSGTIVGSDAVLTNCFVIVGGPETIKFAEAGAPGTTLVWVLVAPLVVFL